MLQKNVYVVYPAGYHGNYLKWAIEVSDLDRRAVTVLDPLNRTSSVSHGGPGTSHGHVRIPTHQAFDTHVSWVIRNRPVDPTVYIINPSGDNIYQIIVQLLVQDPEGIIITINDGNDKITQSYGRINCVTKWPTFMPAIDAVSSSGKKRFKFHKNFDPFNCAGDRLFRNGMVTNINLLTQNVLDFSTESRPLNFEDLHDWILRHDNWYQVRNQYQPHEVNETTYIPKIDYKNRLYQLNITDIPNDKFLSQLQDILTTSEISSNFDLDVVNNYHRDYILAQPNLQWFDSFAHWDQTGELDNYLLSHSIIEAEIIREIMWRCHVRFDLIELDHMKWRHFYMQARGPDWPAMPQTEAGFYQLPEHIQKEILLDFNYKLMQPAEPNPIMLALDWQNMSLPDINQVYQTQINSQNYSAPIAQLV